MTIPVMEPPEEFRNDPAIREAFAKTASQSTGEPATYSEMVCRCFGCQT